MIKVKKFSTKYEEFTFYYVAIYNSETYTETEIDNYINLFTHDVIERYDGIIFMLEKDWHWLHEMILKDYIPKEI